MSIAVRQGRAGSRRAIRWGLISLPHPRVWLVQHLHAAVYTLGLLARAPLNTLTTSAIIGIALALPTGLYVLLDNINTLSGRWAGGTQVSLYLTETTTDDEARRLRESLTRQPGIIRVDLISRSEALKEYQRLIGFSDLRDVFGEENPLPVSLVVFPDPRHSDPDSVETLVRELGRLEQVELVQSDLDWVERLHAMVRIMRRGVLILTGLFSIGVLLIVGNTIRLGIEHRHEEIEIQKLVGATDAFIRRPFLYSGLWYGLLGAMAACLLIIVALEILEPSVAELARLYESDFGLTGPNLMSVLVLLAGGTLLGVLGSWSAVARHLHAIEPS